MAVIKWGKKCTDRTVRNRIKKKQQKTRFSRVRNAYTVPGPPETLVRRFQTVSSRLCPSSFSGSP